MRQMLLVRIFLFSWFTLATTLVYGQKGSKLIFDISHGQNPKIAKGWNEYLLNDSEDKIEVNSQEIRKKNLKKAKAVVIFSPTAEFKESEIKAMINYLNRGGSLLLIFDEERRTPLDVGINRIIDPFGLSLTEDVPVRHNCGAVAERNEICSARRELPYSGGRSIIGGNVISKVYDDGEFVHCAYIKTKKNGKLIVMSDGMAGLLMGEPDGVRFSGTDPSNSKYWGKDSEIFMKEILAFLLSN